MNQNQSPVRKLSRDEFQSALAKGLGRAKLYVMHNGLDEVADLVLNGCFHDVAYDPQCESSRADWLLSLINETRFYPKFREEILSALAHETEAWDLVQLFELTKIMADHGDHQARQAVKTRALEIPTSSTDVSWAGAKEWLQLTGAEGMLDLARVYGHQLLQNNDDNVNDMLLDLTDRKEEFLTILSQHTTSEPPLKAYWDYLEKRGFMEPPDSPADRETKRQQNQQQFRQRISLDFILGSPPPSIRGFIHSKFGRHATQEELEIVYNRIFTDIDNDTRLRLLWVFHDTPMPQLNEQLFQWATGPDEAFRNSAISVLAQMSNPRIHALARSKVDNRQLVGADENALDLFIKNYDPSDARLILQALVSITPKAGEIHHLSLSILNLVEQHKDPNLIDILKWIYENNPCSICRHETIQRLVEFNQFTPALIHECLYDASEEIRQFARNNRDTYLKI